MDIDAKSIEHAFETLKGSLLSHRNENGVWRGELSSSALATATVITALSLIEPTEHEPQIEAGIQWLCENPNEDGGFGDATSSKSNLTATLLCRAALQFAPDNDPSRTAKTNADKWITQRVGDTSFETIANALDTHYGKDKTFSVPILTMCLLSGWFGDDPKLWRRIKPLPFELAIFPHEFFSRLRLHVVSYALPALISMGLLHFRKAPPKNPLTRFIRKITQRKVLAVLRSTQPNNGGFLEATTLTSFVAMTLASCGCEKSDIVKKAASFLVSSMRPDGSYPIDTDLATWVTTQSVNALAAGGNIPSGLTLNDRRNIQSWLLYQQHRKIHPFTHAAPGGWGWTDLPGAVPDADDTAGALVAMVNLGLHDDQARRSVIAGTEWLMGVQNSDGGIATFCRGWSKLPFDRSTTDLTAHAIRGISLWLDGFDEPLKTQAERSIKMALHFLKKQQAKDGSWLPLWFGNENSPDNHNPIYGTSRVLSHLCSIHDHHFTANYKMLERSAVYLMDAQNQDGGFGGAAGLDPTIEETALALDGLSAFAIQAANDIRLLEQITFPQLIASLEAAAKFLITRTSTPDKIEPAPIGLYFASLWYHEKLYPLIFTISALQRLSKLYS
jgi:squalene-hopene/tetraprenyl-beta-curcumene cyclase